MAYLWEKMAALSNTPLHLSFCTFKPSKIQKLIAIAEKRIVSLLGWDTLHAFEGFNYPQNKNANPIYPCRPVYVKLSHNV